MRLANLKIWVQLLVTIGLALAVVWAGGILWQNKVNRDAAIEQARGFSLSMHDATMAGLTGMMVTGTIAQRSVFLDQIKQLNNIRDVRVVRGEAITKTFGPGSAAEVHDPDADEKQVLATGQEIVRVESDGKGEYLRAVRPTLARKNYLGKDCTTCHQVAENAVLGVVSMKLSLDESMAAIARQRAMAMFMALLTCIPVLLIIHPFIRKVVTRPLDQGVTIARDIAAGDLTHPIVVASTNEIGRLQQALKDMRDSLVTVVGRVREGTRTIATASGQIASGNLDLSSRTDAQAEALRATAESMAHLTQTARQNADHARQANEMAISASKVAVQGGTVVSQVVATMDSINASSSRISDIVTVIDGIAFQTNILALNAAVEASRAGEHGRGFAVVASEVRVLAQRSADAAKEIKALIDASVTQTHSGSKLVHQAGSTMNEVVTSIQRVTDLMGGISAASLGQISGIEQVNSAMAQMDGTTRMNAQLVDEAAAATRSLQEQAAHLDEVVGVFKLGREHSHAG
ncbi:methyl-accepting chemotaxis protein [Ideonella sp. A 288]|uniref:methyl-accepting chemotaxis protein n=1 Tax=Ideonella sp. A 288 TaxID=1962181 RepID=UPI000B4AB552|nr:methyl-accepting chemotaxis protein [Ideonella sp. A 288]